MKPEGVPQPRSRLRGPRDAYTNSVSPDRNAPTTVILGPNGKKPRPTLGPGLHRKEADLGDTPHRGPDAPGRSGVLNG